MLSYNLRSTARKLSVSSGPSSMSRKSSKIIDGLDDKYKLKVQLQQRRLTATPRDLNEDVFFDDSSPSRLLPTEVVICFLSIVADTVLAPMLKRYILSLTVS